MMETPKKNLLDDDFIKLFKPLIYIQTILGSVKVNIRNNLISPPLWIQTGYSLIYITVNLVFTYLAKSSGKSENKLLVLDLWQIYGGLFLNVSVIILNNTVNRSSMVELFLTLQTIDRNLKVIGKERHNRKIYLFMIQSIIVAILIVFLHMLQMYPFIDPAKTWFILFSMSIYTVEDAEMILFMMIMIVLHQRICYINKMLDCSSEMRWQQAHMDTKVFESIWRAFVGVIHAVRFVEKIFRIFILYLVIHLFVYQLLNVKKAFVLKDHMMMTKIELLCLLVWPLWPDVLSTKFVLRICVISILIQRLEASVLQTKDSCITALKVNNASSRCYIKNIIRLISTEMESMTIFNMFPMNNVALQSVALTTNYSIVLCQFALHNILFKN